MTSLAANPMPRDRAATGLAAATAAGYVAALVITGGLVLSFDWTGAATAWWVAAGVGLLALLVTLPITALVASRVKAADADAMVRLSSIVMAIGLLRMVVVGLGVIVPVKLYETATWPTFGFVVAHYALLTLAEVGVLGWLFWRKDSTSPAPPNDPPAESPAR